MGCVHGATGRAAPIAAGSRRTRAWASFLPPRERSLEGTDWQEILRRPEAIRRLGAHDHWYRASVYENPLYDLSAAVRLATEIWIRLDDRYLRPDRLASAGLFRPDSEAFRIQMAIFREFARQVRGNGAEPVVLILPDQEAVTRDRRGSPRAFDPLLAGLSLEGLESLDATGAFRADADASIPSWFMDGGHYSPAGNRLVARWLRQELRRRSRDALPLLR